MRLVLLWYQSQTKALQNYRSLSRVHADTSEKQNPTKHAKSINLEQLIQDFFQEDRVVFSQADRK